MEQYIPKSALVAEIERRISINETCQKISGGHDFYRGAIDEAKEIISIINTNEVKKVNLEKKEIIDKACWWLNNNRLGVIDDDYIKEFRKAINN